MTAKKLIRLPVGGTGKANEQTVAFKARTGSLNYVERASKQAGAPDDESAPELSGESF